MFQTIILEGTKKDLFISINDSHKEMYDAGYEFIDMSSSDAKLRGTFVFITYRKKD